MTQAQITINQVFIDAVGERGVSRYVDTLVEASHRVPGGATVTDIDELLRTRFDEHDIALDDVTRGRLAEQIAGIGEDDLVILAPNGEPVHGSKASEESEAHTIGEEPEDPDRPTYS